MKKYIFLVIIFFIIIHFRDYYKRKNKYEILTIKYNKNIDSHLREKLPAVIYNLPFKQIPVLFSPLSISKHKILLNSGYYMHFNDKLFIYTDRDTSLEIMIPKEIYNFKKKTINNGIVNLKSCNLNYRYILMNIYKNTIIFIPRYWIFRVINSGEIYINTNATFFSTLFRIFN